MKMIRSTIAVLAALALYCYCSSNAIASVELTAVDIGPPDHVPIASATDLDLPDTIDLASEPLGIVTIASSAAVPDDPVTLAVFESPPNRSLLFSYSHAIIGDDLFDSTYVNSGATDLDNASTQNYGRSPTGSSVPYGYRSSIVTLATAIVQLE